MRPNVAPVDMARRAASLVLAAALLATPALAGDRALIDLIGYSPDGRYFAFEEYGIQDGSGFAYSSIYIVDLPADKWVYASPYRAQADEIDTDRPLADVRAEARAMAEEKLGPLAIGAPADVLVLLGDGVADADGKEVTFAIPSWGPPGATQEGSESTLTLTTYPADSPEPCADYIGQKAVGYALSLEENGQTRELHRDKVLPKSRGCPLDYRLYGVVERFDGGGGRVALISSYPFGFEGPDRRFLAVPLDR